MPPKLPKTSSNSQVAESKKTPVADPLGEVGHDLDPAKFVSFPDSPFQLYQPFPPAGDQPAAAVAGVAVGVVRGLAEHRDGAALLVPAQHAVVGNVAPHEVVAAAVPCRAFRPEHAGVQAADGRVPLNEFFKLGFEHNGIGIWIALRRLAGPVAGQQGRGGGGNGETGQEGAAAGVHGRKWL